MTQKGIAFKPRSLLWLQILLGVFVIVCIASTLYFTNYVTSRHFQLVLNNVISNGSSRLVTGDYYHKTDVTTRHKLEPHTPSWDTSQRNENQVEIGATYDVIDSWALRSNNTTATKTRLFHHALESLSTNETKNTSREATKTLNNITKISWDDDSSTTDIPTKPEEPIGQELPKIRRKRGDKIKDQNFFNFDNMKFENYLTVGVIVFTLLFTCIMSIIALLRKKARMNKKAQNR